MYMYMDMQDTLIYKYMEACLAFHVHVHVYVVLILNSDKMCYKSPCVMNKEDVQIYRVAVERKLST